MRRRQAELIAMILQAFFEQGTWKQSDLARRTSSRVETLRETLEQLISAGWPLERQSEPPFVWWSLPKGWMPEGVLLVATDIPDLLRSLARAPRSTTRDRIIKQISRAAPPMVPKPASVWIAPNSNELEEVHLPVIEASYERQVALYFRYFTASRVSCEWRHASVQRIVAGPPARIAAICHRSNALRWFRVDGILQVRIDEREPFRSASREHLETFLEASIDGFNQGMVPIECAFTVREPEARWVKQNLLEHMTAASLPTGIRVTARTSAPLRVARFVVGLGGAAQAETPELRTLVEELARGALGLESKD